MEGVFYQRRLIYLLKKMQTTPAQDGKSILDAKQGEVIENLLEELGGYRAICCLAERPHFQTWRGHASTWHATDSEGREVVLKVYDTVLTFWMMQGYDIVDIRRDMAEYCSRYEAQFGLEASSSLSPWLRYHRDDARGLLVLSRPYYAHSLVEHLASSDHGTDVQVSLEALLPFLHGMAAAMDALSAQGILANVSANNLFVHTGKVVLTDWGTHEITYLIKRHDSETKIITEGEHAEGFWPSFEDMKEGRAFLPLFFSTLYRLAQTYFFLRTGHPVHFYADLGRLKQREERVIVMDALSEQNPYSTCGDFVNALGRLIRAD